MPNNNLSVALNNIPYGNITFRFILSDSYDTAISNEATFNVGNITTSAGPVILFNRPGIPLTDVINQMPWSPTFIAYINKPLLSLF